MNIIANRPTFTSQKMLPPPKTRQKMLPAPPMTMWQGDSRLALFYLNDLHSSIDFMPHLMQASDNFDKKYKDITSFKVSGGDMKVGIGENFNNIAIDFMNSIGIEFSALGNHELDVGDGRFMKQLPKMNTKFIASNINVKRKSPLKDYFKKFERFDENLIPQTDQRKKTLNKKLFKSCIVEKDGQKYGFIGLATPDLKTYKKRLNLIKILDIYDKKVLGDLQKKHINKLQKQGVNKIILLSHLGTAVDKKIVSQLGGIDIVIESHDHNRTYKAIKIRSKTNEPVLMVQAGQNGSYFGVLDVIFDKDGVIRDHHNDLYKSKINRISSDKINKIWDKYLGKQEQIATLKQEFPAFMDKRGENPLVNIFAEAMLAMDHENSSDAKKADIAFITNVSKLRKNGLQEEITNRDIFKFNPWGDRIYKTTVSGQKILDILKYGTKTFLSDPSKPILIHSSNISYTLDFNQNEPQDILKDVKIIPPKNIMNTESSEKEEADPINPDKLYTIVFDQKFLDRIGHRVRLEPKPETFTWHEWKDQLAENEQIKIEKPKICAWDKTDAVIDYMKELSQIPTEDGSLLDTKLKGNNRIKIIPPKSKQDS